MIGLAILFAIVAVAVYFMTARLRKASRLLLALSIFLVGVGGATGMLIHIGDEAEPDAVTIQRFE